MKYLQKRLIPFFYIFLALSLLGAFYKIFACESYLDTSFQTWLLMLFHFLIQIIIVFNTSIIGYVAYLCLLPKKFHLKKPDLIISDLFIFIFSIILIFSKMAEGLFWNEFGVSFNFIAVDYLIYTKEVVGNIWQSYPMGKILLSIGVIAGAIAFLHNKFILNLNNYLEKYDSSKEKLAVLCGMVVFSLIAYNCYDLSMCSSVSENKFNQEICKNDLYSFFNAFVSNKISYKDFYRTQSPEENINILMKEYCGENVRFISSDSLTRIIESHKPEERKNVIVVVMESMDAKFMNENRIDRLDITPNLTKLAEEGLYFNNVYCTGTRTVRGLEAVALSLPPQAGMSVVRQKNNGNLVNVGTIFRKKGYSTKWFYGGYGYFDNMNDFFEGNGFEKIDRTDIASEKIIQSTIWGVADEVLYDKVIEENDKSYDPNKPFFEIVLTTSNHRPFDFPEGRIDFEPVKGGRLGAVKYADWSIGHFIEKAKKTSWFKNTVFVFIADHGSSSAGEKDLNPDKHRIPLIIYSPDFIKPQRVEKVISQIDTMPTLLALLNFSYESRLMGRNALEAPDDGRFFLSNYQCIGYAEKNKLAILKPVRDVVIYVDGKKQNTTDDGIVKKAIAYYQYSSDWKGLLGSHAD